MARAEGRAGQIETYAFVFEERRTNGASVERKFLL